MIWVILHEFPQYTLETVADLSMQEVGFLLGGLNKFYTVKKKGARR